MRIVNLALLASVVALAGCSDGSRFGNNATSGGKVVDGYLAGALVCADENLSRSCDPSEPSTTTDARGNFRLTGLTSRQARVPLVMEVQPGTIDLDTGLAPPAGLKYFAPAGSKVVSALSTVIQARIEAAIALAVSLGEPVPSLQTLKAQANASLAADLGLPGINLLAYDPVALKNNEALSNSVRRTAAEIHVVNQILSEQIANLLPAAEALVPGEEDAAFSVVISKLDPADVRAAVEADLTAFTLNDFLTNPAMLDNVTSETPPTAPTVTEVNDQVAADADIREAINNKLPDPTPTGGTSGA